MAEEQRKTVFARQATGLVREFNHLDLFVQAISIMQIGISTIFLLESVGGFYPGTNLFALVLFSGIVGLAFAAVWSMMSAAMPRSGGDYVWISRVLNKVPGVGFMYATTYGLAFAIAFNMGFQVWLFTNGVLSPTFAGLGIVYGNSVLTNFGNSIAAGNGLFLVGLLLIALAIGTVALGARLGSRIINILFFFSLLVTVLWIILGFATSTGAFQSAFNAQFGSGQYTKILTLGQQAGFSGFTFNLFATLQVGFSLGYFSLYSNFQYPVWASGEIKRATQVWRPYFAAMAVTGLLYALLISGLFHMFGGNWLGSISVAETNSTTAAQIPFSVPPTFTMLMTVLFKGNPILVFLINAGLVAGSFTWFVVPYIAFSRLIFSMSFDRVLPRALSDVNERFRVPLKALGVTIVLVILWFSQYVYGLLWNPNFLSFASVFFSVSAIAPAAWTVAALVFAFFPWINRGLYERSMPSAFRRNIGLPVITWLGLFVAVTQAWAVYGYVTTAAPSKVIAIGAILVIMIGSFAGYYVIRAIRKSQGLDLKHVFSEIPPE
jgi:APA family basic amino acid/polyamine antiporter